MNSPMMSAGPGLRNEREHITGSRQRQGNDFLCDAKRDLADAQARRGWFFSEMPGAWIQSAPLRDRTMSDAGTKAQRGGEGTLVRF